MVLAGKINKDLVNLLQLHGGEAMGLCGIDGHMLTAEKINDDLGYVGDITEVNSKPILDALEMGYIPVISSVACDKEGNVYNVNADTAAAKLAVMPDIDCSMERDIISKLSELNANAYRDVQALKQAEADAAAISDAVERADSYCKKVIPAMQALRAHVDAMEPLTASEYWPLPTYGDMMFRV